MWNAFRGSDASKTGGSEGRDVREGGVSRNRVALLGMVLAAAGGLMPTPAEGVVAGTSHAVTSGTPSECSVCHIPGGDGRAGVWPVLPVPESPFVGTVSTLCASCHFSTGAYGGSFTGANSDTFVYGPLSHGVQMTIAEIP